MVQLTLPILKPCVDLEGYSVDEDGNVYSHLRRVSRGNLRGWVTVVDRAIARMIKPEPDKWGYLRVRVWIEGRRTWRRVNVLVCQAFNGPQPEGKPHVRHDDGVRTNNRATNLLWGSVQENADDKLRHGTVLGGASHPLAMFSNEQVLEILEEYSAGMDPATIAAVRGCHVTTIHKLVSRRTYRNCGGAIFAGGGRLDDLHPAHEGRCVVRPEGCS